MTGKRLLFCALAVFALSLRLPAAPQTTTVWRNEIGQEVHGELSGVYGPYALIASKTQSSFMPLVWLDTPSLDRVANFLAQQPQQAPLWKDSSSDVSRALRKRLQILQGEKLAPFDYAQRPEPEFYLVYFSAHWCGPCRRFTPKLRETYQRLRAHPAVSDRFELIFISSDENVHEQRHYAQEASMPWPMVGFNSLGSVGILEHLKGNGIPCLVVVNRKGHILFHSYQGAEYLGPEDPLDKFIALMDQSAPTHPETKLARHRLAIRQYVLAGATTNLPPKPYLIDFDLSRYADLPVKNFMLRATIDEQGTVTDARTDPALPAVSEAMLVNDAKSWRFLPAIENGVPTVKSVAIPFTL
ncbi:hypothetical protein CMV30_13500 [Nibricoccus aquaticus]|uniref:Thioredoxin domain-containing protein n=1 Tax=Nibricoccus aquaticus TaxID=2576891 RepID=A0A290Q8C5_9BACT|nr:thioredoxin-like domain-containing protein [Nibricoccus aquaticus]ATC64899.1 hypothetical protein CMV30_13500 [Nibricoccus aquaticus]